MRTVRVARAAASALAPPGYVAPLVPGSVRLNATLGLLPCKHACKHAHSVRALAAPCCGGHVQAAVLRGARAGSRAAGGTCRQPCCGGHVQAAQCADDSRSVEKQRLRTWETNRAGGGGASRARTGGGGAGGGDGEGGGGELAMTGGTAGGAQSALHPLECCSRLPLLFAQRGAGRRTCGGEVEHDGAGRASDHGLPDGQHRHVAVHERRRHVDRVAACAGRPHACKGAPPRCKLLEPSFARQAPCWQSVSAAVMAHRQTSRRPCSPRCC